MGDETEKESVNETIKSSSTSTTWEQYLDLPKSLQESTDTAIRSARSLQHSSTTHFRSLRDLFPQLVSQYKTYEDEFVDQVKYGVSLAKQNPGPAAGIAVATGFLFMRGPRRFLLRNTIGRFRSEEAQFVRAERNVKDLSLSLEVMKNDSKKLLERAGLAETDMKVGQTDLMNAGAEIRSLAKFVYKAEAEATDLMDLLREIPGREALKLRAEVASMASYLRQQKIVIDKKIMKISELGVPV